MTDPRDRAERAFADAFAARAAPDPEPLDPLALRAAGAKASGRRRWLPLAAAAAVLVAAGAVGVLRAAGPADTARLPASAEVEAGGARDAGVAGLRDVSMLDVVVQVPREWGYDRALGPDWCADGAQRRPSDPAAPFVDVRPEGRVVRGIACGGDVPAERQTMHLTWRHADAIPSDLAPPDGWIRVGRRVGSAVLTVVAPEGERSLADQILATARQVAVDHNGCPVAPDAAPLPSGPDAVLCQYVDPEPGVPGLVGSRALDADAAARLLAELDRGAPVAPTPCPEGADTLVTLTVPGGQARLRVPACGAAFVDDGTTRRALTADTCRLVFAPPLALPDGRACG